ncbi:MAG: lipid-A-disaccharide synthase [bacterium]|nr:lipid-A-disaccharide synthase [bacterium]
MKDKAPDSSPLIAVIAVEPSGDMEGAELVKAMRRLHPEFRFTGVGSKCLRQAGVDIWQDTEGLGTMGVAEALRKLPDYIRKYQATRDRLLELRPDLTILIDSPALNVRLAGKLQKFGLRCAYYFPPSAWTDNPKRYRRIHRISHAVMCVFPKNASNYRKLGLKVCYYGHPLLDMLSDVPGSDEARRILGAGPAAMAVMPGSRMQEIEFMIPVFLETARIFKREVPHLEVLIPCVSLTAEKYISQYIHADENWIKLVSGNSRLVMSASRLVLAASGTVTLEAALLGKPMIVAYKVAMINWLAYMPLVSFGLLKLDHIALPNLVLDKRAVPEHIQRQASPHILIRQVRNLWHDGPVRARMLEDLQEVKNRLGGKPGVNDKLAADACSMALGQEPEGDGYW